MQLDLYPNSLISYCTKPPLQIKNKQIARTLKEYQDGTPQKKKHPETIPLQIYWDLDFFDSLDGFFWAGKAPHSETSIYSTPMFLEPHFGSHHGTPGVPVTPSFWTGGLDHFFLRGRPFTWTPTRSDKWSQETQGICWKAMMFFVKHAPCL